MAQKTTFKIDRDSWVRILVAMAEASDNLPDGTVITFDKRDLKMLYNFKSTILHFSKPPDNAAEPVTLLARIIERLAGNRMQFIVSMGPADPGGKP